MTELDNLKGLRIPSNLTSEQIYQLFVFAYRLTYRHQASPNQQRILSGVADLSDWFLKQDFQKQMNKV